MKKNILQHALFLPLIFAACTSTPLTNHDEPVDEAAALETLKENPVESEYLASLNNVILKLESAPKFTTVGNNFTKPFTILVTDNSGIALAAYPVTVSYPSKKEDGKIIYAEENLLSDENGKCTFTAQTPAFACQSNITFFPTPVSDSEKVLAAAKEKSVSSAWTVRSDIVKTGAVLFIWEFNELNRPVKNSYDVLSKLKSYGIWNVGNAPVNEPTDIGKSLTSLYKENYEIIEDAYGYLICGTIKFSKPVTALENGKGYSCTMVADISAVNMKNGSVVFHQTFEQYAEGSNWNNVTQTCKTKISDKITDSLIFGL